MVPSTPLHPGPGRSRSTKLLRMEVDLWRADGCTDARTCDPQVGWCTKNPKKRGRGTPGAARSAVAAARRASAQAKLNSTQRGAPDPELVYGTEGTTCDWGADSPGLRASS